MSLAEYTPKRRKVLFDGGEFEVRAVSLSDVAGLISRHQDAVDRVAAILRAQEQFDFTDAQMTGEILLNVARESPYLVADLISSCADEPEAYEGAFRLPLTVQVDALQKIGEITFADMAALKKFAAGMKNLLTGLRQPATDMAA